MRSPCSTEKFAALNDCVRYWLKMLCQLLDDCVECHGTGGIWSQHILDDSVCGRATSADEYSPLLLSGGDIVGCEALFRPLDVGDPIVLAGVEFPEVPVVGHYPRRQNVANR